VQDHSKVFLQRVRDSEDAPYNEETYSRDEVREYLDSRYICDKDSCWRVYGYDIHKHYPAVERMPVHLPNKNYITYKATSNMVHLLSQSFLQKTILTEWFAMNQQNPDARDLTYCDFPSKW
jgi:hypothetical protein